jgi:tRNA uridine 5-carboxymethylaminomethyl modification enzyme
MTSRSEYRLLLRQDNADRRLTEIGRKIGLVDDEAYERYLLKKQHIEDEIERIKNTGFGPSEELSKILEERNSTPITNGIKMADLLRRPEMTYESLAPIDKERPTYLTPREKQAVEIEIKYEGYIKKELAEAERFTKLEKKVLPEDIDYYAVKGIRAETQQKLTKFRPKNIGQASRISGVSPADISVLLIYLDGAK